MGNTLEQWRRSVGGKGKISYRGGGWVQGSNRWLDNQKDDEEEKTRSYEDEDGKPSSSDLPLSLQESISAQEEKVDYLDKSLIHDTASGKLSDSWEERYDELDREREHLVSLQSKYLDHLSSCSSSNKLLILSISSIYLLSISTLSYLSNRATQAQQEEQ